MNGFDFNDNEDLDDANKRPKSLRRRAASRLAAVQTLISVLGKPKDPTVIVPEFKEHFLANITRGI